MAVQCTDVDVLSLVALVPLGSENTFIMETISAVDGTAKAGSWGIKKGYVLYIKPKDPWVIPASKAGFAHLLVVPLSSHAEPFVEEDQPWLPNHYKKILDGTLLCCGDTTPCREEAGNILQLHVSMIWDLGRTNQNKPPHTPEGDAPTRHTPAPQVTHGATARPATLTSTDPPRHNTKTARHTAPQRATVQSATAQRDATRHRAAQHGTADPNLKD